jgi:hypothetical protein
LRHKARLESFKGPILESLRDVDEEVRLLTIGIVKGFGAKAPDAIPALLSLTKDPSPASGQADQHPVISATYGAILALLG